MTSPSTPNTPTQSINAWILLSEDDPATSNYHTPGSSYQSLIKYGVYRSVDMLNICFFDTIKRSDGSYTLQIGQKVHPGGATNADYLKWTVRDARAANPSIKILATLGYGKDEFLPVFTAPSTAASYAKNVLAFLQANDLDGIDIDWEPSVDSSLSVAQFASLFQAIRLAFSAATERYYYLTLSPANWQPQLSLIDAPTVNTCFDFVNLQLYSGYIQVSQYAGIGITPALLQFGAKFESTGSGQPAPYQTAQQVWELMRAGYSWNNRPYVYSIATQWRLNSGNFQFEQAQQMLLHQLAYGTPPGPFDDSPIAGAAGNPPITQLTVRAGDVLDAIQATSTGAYQSAPLTYPLPHHGGQGGSPTVISLDAGDLITGVNGYTGPWYGWGVVLQVTFTTKNNKTYGPYGSMAGSTTKTAFSLSAPANQSIVAFTGSTVLVPEAGGSQSYVVAALNIVCA